MNTEEKIEAIGNIVSSTELSADAMVSEIGEIIGETANNNDNRPALAFYHANAKGTGCAVKMTLWPAKCEMGGGVIVRMANQKSIGSRSGAMPTFPTFDWDNEIKIKFDFNDICQMLQVFRGEFESIADGRGLLHRSQKRTVVIRLSHIIEPVCCYCLEVIERECETDKENTAKIVFSTYEALGICETFAGSLSRVVFG